MLKKRLLTAMLMLPIIISLLVLAPPSYVCLFLGFLVAGCSFEASFMLTPEVKRRFGVGNSGCPTLFSGIFCSTVGVIVFICSTLYNNEPWGGVAGIAFILMTTIGVGSFSTKTVDLAVSQVLSWVFSILYGSLPWVALWHLYLEGKQARYLLLLLAIIMFNDSGAYFSGRYFGKRKLAPHYSPKKTWEGVIGGMVSGVFGAYVVNAIFNFQGEKQGAWFFLTLAGILVGIAGILGDLVESALKRFSNVKDSGDFFPGHGGFMDRSDSIVFAAPLLWVLLTFYKLS